MRNLTIMLATTACMLTLAQAPAMAQNNGLGQIFNCSNDNSRQGTGTLVGGLIGGVVGNQAAGDDDRTLGTVLGAAIGAAAGSYVGCQMSSADTSQAEAATLNALNTNRSTTWSNARSGASGRVDIVNSYNRNDVSGRTPGYNGQNGRDDYQGNGRDRDNDQASLRNVRFARGVQVPQNYTMLNSRYTTNSTRVNVRSRPDPRASVVTTLRANETFDVLARAGNSAWLLASRDGVAIGYVSENVVRFAGRNNEYARAGGNNGNGYNGNGANNGNNSGYNNGRGNDPRYQQATQVCRTFDQTIQTRNGNSTSRPTTQRFTACQNTAGQWVIEA